jgi:predicted nucleotidyltransferase
LAGIALVGSFARGEARSGSDLDMVALVEGESPERVETFLYHGWPVEVLFKSEVEVWKAVEEETLPEKVVPAWAEARILYDPEGRFARLVAEIRQLYRKGPPPMSAEERRYASFELEHLRRLLLERAQSEELDERATLALLLAQAVRFGADALIRLKGEWPANPRRTVPALREVDGESAELAVRALAGGRMDLARAFLERVQGELGGPPRELGGVLPDPKRGPSPFT